MQEDNIKYLDNFCYGKLLFSGYSYVWLFCDKLLDLSTKEMLTGKNVTKFKFLWQKDKLLVRKPSFCQDVDNQAIDLC